MGILRRVSSVSQSFYLFDVQFKNRIKFVSKPCIINGEACLVLGSVEEGVGGEG